MGQQMIACDLQPSDNEKHRCPCAGHAEVIITERYRAGGGHAWYVCQYHAKKIARAIRIHAKHGDTADYRLIGGESNYEITKELLKEAA